LPWKNASISGWILDPDRKKMSKSKGNVVTPIDLLEEYGSDAVRYWAAMGRPGTDTAFDTGQMKIGKRLAIKLLNASKFSLSLNATLNNADVTQSVDHALLNKLAQVVETATTSFEKYDYTRALEVAETFFWAFTDDYVELVKERTYGNQGEAAANSARAALGITTHTLLKLFAPFIPFVTEEVWSWWQEGSIHLQSWPKLSEIITNKTTGIDALNNVTWILSEVRKVKTENKQSMKAEVKSLEIWAKADVIDQVKDAQKDLIAAGNIKDLKLNVSDSDIKVKVELA
jgi:valyl-tRNA synthetase